MMLSNRGSRLGIEVEVNRQGESCRKSHSMRSSEMLFEQAMEVIQVASGTRTEVRFAGTDFLRIFGRNNAKLHDKKLAEAYPVCRLRKDIGR